MKRTIPILLAAMLLAQMGLSQQRDRRVDLKIPCYANIDISTTGQLWMCDRCGNIWVADSMEGSWRTVLTSEKDYMDGKDFEHVAGFGPKTAVAMGYLHPSGVVWRTTDGGRYWDTVDVDPKLIWTRGFCYHSDGRLWIASCKGRDFTSLSYSDDEGRTFTRLKPPFVTPADEDGIMELYMTNANDGYAGTYGNGLYHTNNNWSTATKLATPLDQGLLKNLDYGDTWIHRIRPWQQWLIVTEASTMAYTSIGKQPHWQPLPLPLVNYEVDAATDQLWGITDSGQLVLMQDMEHWRIVRDNVCKRSICGTLNGHIYLETSEGVVRIRPDGQADTCGFFTEEMTLEEFFDKTEKQHRYGREPLSTIHHGGRLWRTDGESIYLQDEQGWYRIAKPLSVQELFPDPDRADRIIILRGPGNDAYIRENYSIDTNGNVEPYIYKNPTEAFVHSGLESVTIKTYFAGCFSYNDHIVSYKRSGDNLVESENTVDSSWHKPYSVAASSVEQALYRLGEQYNLFPTPKDFGLHKEVVDFQEVFDPHKLESCTSYAGYRVVFVNRDGDTLTVRGSSDKDCGGYFPWLLPMQIRGTNIAFTTCQPGLWKALRPMMPVGMNLREYLNPLAFLRRLDLLFFSDTAGMGSAVRACTGQYSHVALVESVGDTVWIIDATPQYGVARRPFIYNPGDSLPFPDVYEIDGAFNEYDVLERARSFIGQPYDHAFRPNNRALYCSELIYECFLNDYKDKGDNHFFEAKPMNWRDANGKIPPYWKKHFKELHIPVPEGVPGTNPSDLSRSPLLKKR